MAGANYRDGSRLSIIVTRNYDWALGLSNAAWNLKTGGFTTFQAFVDGKMIASGRAEHLERDLAILPLRGAEAYRALQIGDRLDLRTPAGNLSFALTGTERAMASVLECVRDLGPQQAPQTTSSTSRALSQAEAAVLLANLLNAANVRGYTLEPPVAGRSGADFRLADGTRGWLMATRGPNTRDADDYAAFVISRNSAACKGEFLSGKQSVASVDGSVVRKVLTTCRSNGTAVVAETIIVRRQNGFIMDLTQFLPASAGEGGQDDNTRATLVDAVMRLPEPR